MGSGSIDYRILEWLGMDVRGLGYYLHFLTMRFAHPDYPEALASLRALIPRLEAEPDYWRSAITGEAGGWRPQLVGSYVLLVSLNRGYADGLRAGLARSFVCPQMAVTYGMLHPDEAREFFAAYLAGADLAADPKLTGAVFTLLTLLDPPAVRAFDLDAFRASPPPGTYNPSHWQADCAIGQGVSLAHWQAWARLTGIASPG